MCLSPREALSASPILGPPILSFQASVCGSRSITWPSSLGIARAAGFAATDLVLPEIAGESPCTIRSRLAATRLLPGPASLPVEFRLDKDTFQRDLVQLPRLAALAAAVGIKTMFRALPASGDVPAPELHLTLRSRISTIATVLAANGITFALEPLGPLHRRREGRYEFIWRLADAAEFASACPDNVGLLLDAWHWHHSGATIQEIIDAGKLIRHVHIADSADLPPDRVRDDSRLLPGEGVVDLNGFFRGLSKAGYCGYVSPEVRGYSCKASPTVCARAAYAASQTSLRAFGC